MDITLGARDQSTGRFNFVLGTDGDVSFDDTEAHAVMTSAIEHKNEYWYNPDHGSDIHTLKTLASKTPSQAVSMTLEAESSLEQANTITNLSVESSRQTSPSGLGILGVSISWSTPGGITQSETI